MGCTQSPREERNIEEKVYSDELTGRIHKGFHHKVDIQFITCPNIRFSKNASKCGIYHAMMEKHQYNQKNLEHLNEFTHFKNEFEEKPVCHYKDDCESFIRSEQGQDDIKDQCHMKLYRHPPRSRNIKLSENIHPLILHKGDTKFPGRGTRYPNDDDKRKYGFNDSIYNRRSNDGFVVQLIEEVIQNGYKYDLCLKCGKNDECKHDIQAKQNYKHSILRIVDDKLDCERHKKMGNPLRRDHMLALLLYTGL